ncbi:hypothetical protein IGI04_012091, partial [Brassica rapa subsp. trilocularis]
HAKHYSLKTKPKSKNFKLQLPPSTINVHELRSCLVQVLFMTMNVSGSIEYLFRFGLDNTCNPKYHKTRSIWYLCRIQIGSV